MKFVIYHKDCADGFGAAWAAWRALGDEDVTYLPMAYGDPLPKEVSKAEAVYMLDFSFPRGTLEWLHGRVPFVKVIDHHASAQRELAGLAFAEFDLDRSAAVMAWGHFHPDRRVPELLLYVQDRDLWRWEMPDSRAVSAALQTYVPRTRPGWDMLYRDWPTMKPKMVAYGQSAIHYLAGITERAAARGKPIEIDGQVVPSACACILQSEIGEALLDLHPEAPFVAVYSAEPQGEMRVSLRSRGDHDCSATAKKFGGGGHPKAAGFAWPSGILAVSGAAAGKEVAA